MSWRKDITDLVEFLEPFNRLDPPNGHWIESCEGDMIYDPDDRGFGSDWCEQCGEDVLMRLNLYTPGNMTYSASWNDTAGEHDSILRCTSCGMTLAGWPTDYCLSEELAYFKGDPEFSVNPENIHVICMALWNLQWGDDSENLFAWRSIGQQAVDKITLSPVSPGMVSRSCTH